MSKLGITIPVVCGGAALNRAYVEVDLRRAYQTGPVYYGTDAFAGLQIMDELTGQSTEKVLTAAPEESRIRHGEMRAEREIRIAEKSQQYVPSDTRPADFIPEPPFWGVRHVLTPEINLAEIFPFINKKALYVNQWMYRRGKRSTADYRKFINEYVDPLFHEWCKRALDSGWIQPKVAYGYFPCNSDKNDLIIYEPENRTKEACRISFPRQIADRRRCISDYFLPKSCGQHDVVAFHVVTSGSLASEKCQELFAADHYTDYLHFYGLSVETAEALAEFWHKKIRQELGIAGRDGATIDSLFRQTYHGSRYSFGYPACPNLEDQTQIFKLLDPEKIGVTLSSEYQLAPEQSTSAIIVHHPEACYYSI
jgi:5-methyltetrahydrofolate--homocysteine methyltransferase